MFAKHTIVYYKVLNKSDIYRKTHTFTTLYHSITVQLKYNISDFKQTAIFKVDKNRIK